MDTKRLLKKAVKVTWRDAHHPEDEWVQIDDLKIPDNIITTYGVLVKEDEHHIMVAQTYCSDGMTAGVFTIVKGQLIKVEQLQDNVINNVQTRKLMNDNSKTTNRTPGKLCF